MAPALPEASAVAPSKAPRASSATPSLSAATTGEPRVLACVMCQQRKVKCNRKFPCNNCIRLGVNCVPATLNPRRRRRRFPERELLDRVRHYETLLRQNKVRFESLFETIDPETGGRSSSQPHEEQEASHDAASSLAALRQSGRGGGGGDEAMVDADGDVDPDTLCQPSSSSVPYSSSTADRGYEAKNFWKAIRNGFHGRGEPATGVGSSSSGQHGHSNPSDGGAAAASASVASPASTSDAESQGPHPSAVVREMWARQLSRTGSLFFRGPQQLKILSQVTALHPGPAQIFRLWQIYLDNVDPLLKITHTPSLQSRIIEAAARPSLAGIDPTLEALMFSIYCVAIHSMTSSDCQATFGSTKQDLLGTYQPACEQALLNSGFLRTSERDCLAAFFLYLISLGHGIDHRTLYAMLGVAMRLAHAMQINVEFNTHVAEKIAPLEAEMRRRLWWAIALFDARISELANHSPTMLDPTWDCYLPLNVNDLDFRPELKEPPRISGGRGSALSEALFAVVRAELANSMRHMDYYLALSNPALKPMARDREFVATAASARATSPNGRPRRREYAEINALEDMIHEKYLQYCDPANGLHFMTTWVARGFVAKCRLIKYFSKFSQYAVNQPPQTSSSSASTPTSTGHSSDAALPSLRDIALDDALTVIEADTNIMTSHLTRGYRWLVHLYFPLPAYIYITQELARRISGERAKYAWAAMNSNCEARFALSDSENRYMFKMFANTILQAWDACEARMRSEGEPEPVEVPEMVQRIRNQLAAAANDDADDDADGLVPKNTLAQTLGSSNSATIDGTTVSGGSEVLGGFSMTLSMDMAQPSLFSGGPPPPSGSGPPSAFGSATPPVPPLFPSPNLGGGMGFGMANLGNWPPMPTPWSWGPRPSWG
ncbi:hypothetical protein SCUCBS95973_008149 [Sporothrix curviconia]|uniref:Zn(2)-C6 fungal-type domain-containing protein n=1 Tax=Sporothrix curviconia TaxID=1260050 RepID=A0ABP0CJG8_9PEZI